MLQGDRIWWGVGDAHVDLLLNQANRHGLIAGASGTGKTVTLKVMAEGFSKAGVPVFMADVKGDVTGMAQAGEDSDNIEKRVERGSAWRASPSRAARVASGICSVAKAAKEAERAAAKAQKEAEKEAERAAKAAEKQKQELFKDVTKTATSILGSIGREASKQIMRGLFGTRKC